MALDLGFQRARELTVNEVVGVTAVFAFDSGVQALSVFSNHFRYFIDRIRTIMRL